MDRFLPEDRGGSYPELHMPGRLESIFPEGSPNTTQKIVLPICDDNLAVCKRRHVSRKEAVVFMMDGDVPPESQNILGNWGGNQRNSHYAYAALVSTAVLTLGGTAKTERGQHHNPTWNRIQPQIELVDFVLPVPSVPRMNCSVPSVPRMNVSIVLDNIPDHITSDDDIPDLITSDDENKTVNLA